MTINRFDFMVTLGMKMQQVMFCFRLLEKQEQYLKKHPRELLVKHCISVIQRNKTHTRDKDEKFGKQMYFQCTPVKMQNWIYSFIQYKSLFFIHFVVLWGNWGK